MQSKTNVCFYAILIFILFEIFLFRNEKKFFFHFERITINLIWLSMVQHCAIVQGLTRIRFEEKTFQVKSIKQLNENFKDEAKTDF